MTENPAHSAADEALARAFAILDRSPLIDGHNDLPILIRRDAAGDVARYDLAVRSPKRDTDIPRLREGRIAAQFWAAFVPPREAHPASYALQQIALVHRMNALHAGVFRPGLVAADVRAAKAEGRIASFITIENGAALEDRLDTLEAFHSLGVRLMTLCHNATTSWCDSATDAPRHQGLSPFGRSVIAKMNSLGMIVDLAHVSDAVMHQVLDLSKAPVVWSHSNARSLCNHLRNVPDDVLARVASNGGLVMATFVPSFICQKSVEWLKPITDEFGKTREGLNEAAEIAAREGRNGPWPRGTLSQYCDHLDYLAARVGHDHVGIGSDFFGGPQGAGLEDASCFPHILAELLRRGWSDEQVEKLAGGNFLRAFAAVEAAAG
jgi:membrane dipeptidase